MNSSSYDVIGIGLGPFNLSLAALIDGTDEEIDALFLEQKSEFSWHGDMLIEGSALQSSFIGDLVTPADPTNPHSFLNYLRKHDRFWEFFNYENFHIPRREYDKYCKWVSTRLDSCQFNRRVESVYDTGDGNFMVKARDPETGEETKHRCDDIALGVGSRPFVPESLRGHPSDDVFHTSLYLDQRERCLEADSITVVGSGQSSAEIFHDLLKRQEKADYRLDWLTRSDGFYPVDPSKLTRELRTPDYIEYFYDLPKETSDDRVAQQDLLYKGISPSTSAAIFDTLYRRSIHGDPDIGMLSKTEVEDIEARDDGRYRLTCNQWEEKERFQHDSEVVILATGYHRPTPEFLDPIESSIEFTEDDQFQVDRDYTVETDGLDGTLFVQNGALHAHGFNIADLSLGAYRNALIVNQLLGREEYSVNGGSRFQSFGTDQFLEESPNSEPISDD
ncbi:lysine N(6)-hydroxylase/L-ornithine N(5)-oxygenase family protein [Halorussus caseinilyticus]|uniref:lysine N(6)-hydroxylase/L-ornithine N(5)-oxygenase family protein n=1 Tax=Halorussus caseinilyticus TaxID=3034025 RepID=UPI0023E814EE|nr:lysine N(6)-hydroxylase/L-ornithine N(5)-oxygenase family protein [Halorussus sp. DT72]